MRGPSLVGDRGLRVSVRGVTGEGPDRGGVVVDAVEARRPSASGTGGKAPMELCPNESRISSSSRSGFESTRPYCD